MKQPRNKTIKTYRIVTLLRFFLYVTFEHVTILGVTFDPCQVLQKLRLVG